MPRGSVPALNARYEPSDNVFKMLSAIIDRAELWVHRNKPSFGSYYSPFLVEG